MPNVHRGEIMVTLGGKPGSTKGKSYVVRIGTNQVCEIEGGLQLPLGKWDEGGLRLVREIMYVATEQHGKRRITRDAMGLLLDSSDMAHVAGQAKKAMDAAYPEGVENADGEGEEETEQAAPLAEVPKAAAKAG